MLINERIRSINNIITMLNHQIDTCMNILKGMINKEVMKECHEFINYTRERRHYKTMERQKKILKDYGRRKQAATQTFRMAGMVKFNQMAQQLAPMKILKQHQQQIQWATTVTVQNNNRVKWVHNLSKTPLTEAQEKVLAHGPNFVIVAKEPPVSKYISQIERACQQLKQGKVEELEVRPSRSSRTYSLPNHTS